MLYLAGSACTRFEPLSIAGQASIRTSLLRLDLCTVGLRPFKHIDSPWRLTDRDDVTDGIMVTQDNRLPVYTASVSAFMGQGSVCEVL